MVTGPSTASFPFNSRGNIATQWTALLQRGCRLCAGDFLHPDNAWTEHHIRQQAMGNGMWGLQGACLLGKERNHKLLVVCAEPCPGWQACCRGQPERAIILWGGGNYSELLMFWGFFPGCPQEWNRKPGMTVKGFAHGQKIMLKYLPCFCHPQCLELFPFLFSSHIILQRSLLWAPFLPRFS